MKNISFSSHFFLIVLTGVISGYLVYLLLGLIEVPFREVAFFSVMSAVIAALLGRMEKKYDETQN
ncbi:hypothetical protein SAMN00777080_2433 [Aquiflexum balticum DSM 16537]|uniref:Uncharacterized protein n=1 Tax=Aquiflexum balticum DSM 16537 TaxID=758820 RepID=A0A1W2H4H7_9BACT|nr:hypothetical protein [Aquiflexum balticum]SMD43823.1 hypothetical protein SAMN00777080_2433 [Aquiflexum balticum DSM 16537]